MDDPFADPRNIDSVLLPLLWHLGQTLEVPPTAGMHADCFGMVNDIANHLDLDLPRVPVLAHYSAESFDDFRKVLEDTTGGDDGGTNVRVGLPSEM